ncbi:TPA: hypothetical protein SLN67_001851 [Serratia marcescens]|nr:hypothetical protein [Serratia marcescens]
MTKKITVYITKYALTQGIKRGEGVMLESGNFMLDVGGIVSKSEFRLNEEDAIKKAEDMRRRKIAHMEEKLRQLKLMKFEVNP